MFVVAKLVMKTQRWHAPFVFHHRIQIHVIFVARQHFAEGPHSDERALILAHLFLEGSSKAVNIGATRKHCASAAAFESVAANKLWMLLLQIPEARQIETARSAIIQSWRLAHLVFRAARDSRTHDVLAEVVPHVA